MDEKKLIAAIGKRSFELNYNGGTIRCEHLDGMGDLEQQVIDKFKGDLPKLQRPSVSSSMMINLDETEVTEAIADAIVDGLAGGKKRFGRIAFVGADRKHRRKFGRLRERIGAVAEFFEDYEKAKEWVL